MIRVLIVEDEALLREGLKKTIDWTAMDAEVCGTAADGREGLMKLDELRPDVVLTDIKMPVMDGLTMLEEARDREIEVTAVILTSYAEFELAQRALRLGSSDYLLKPVDEGALREVFKRLHVGGHDVRQGGESEQVLTDWAALSRAARQQNAYAVRALSEITEHYTEDVSIEKLAEELGVSASYLSRKFKEATGQTFGALLASRRIEAAMELLSGDLKVYEVAERVGFHDYKNFCVVFKKLLHKTPMEYQRE